MTNKLQPRLRFKGFTELWTQRQLGEVATVFDGPHATPSKTERGPWYLSISSLIDGRVDLDQSAHMSEEDLATWTKRVSPLPGDTLFSYETRIGQAGHWDFEEQASLGRRMGLLRPKDGAIDVWYLTLSYLGPQFQDVINENTVSGGTVERIPIADMPNWPLVVPSIAEQKRIGEFFRLLDDLITANQSKADQLQHLKRAYLQQLFPAPGQVIPHLRFPSFRENWSLKPLGELAQIKTGSSDVQDAVSSGAYPFFIRSQNVERSNKYLYDGEAILIPGEGRLGEIFHYTKGKFDFHQRVYKISDFIDSVDAKFILYTMQATFKKHAMSHTVKATVDSLRLPMLTEYQLMLPGVEEQRLLGHFFYCLDELNRAQNERVEHLKCLKRGYLQKMLV